MISAPSMNGAASSANRIMSTAPMAKLAAMTQLARGRLEQASASSSRSSSPMPVVPTTAWTPCDAHHRMCSTAASATVKSTATSAPARSSVLDVAGHLQARRSDAGHLAQVDPGQRGVDGGHQLELGVVGDGPAHLAAHPPAGAEHPDSHAWPNPTDGAGAPGRAAAPPVRPGGHGASGSNGPTTDRCAVGPPAAPATAATSSRVTASTWARTSSTSRTSPCSSRLGRSGSCGRRSPRGQQGLGPQVALGHRQLPVGDAALAQAVELAVDEVEHLAARARARCPR